jgi:TRAP-type C4-dicarboxylate transport system permease small subunit
MPDRSPSAVRSWGRAVDRLLWGAIDGLLLICVSGMLVAVAVQVASRLAGASLPWTEELSRLLFIWTAFLGMAVGFRRVEHPRITLLVDRLPRLAALAALQLYAWAGIVFFAIVGWYALKLVQQQIRVGETSPVLGIGMYLATLPAVLAAVLAILAHLVTVYGDPESRAGLAGSDKELR